MCWGVNWQLVTGKRRRNPCEVPPSTPPRLSPSHSLLPFTHCQELSGYSKWELPCFWGSVVCRAGWRTFGWGSVSRGRGRSLSRQASGPTSSGQARSIPPEPGSSWCTLMVPPSGLGPTRATEGVIHQPCGFTGLLAQLFCSLPAWPRR